jgi:PAS domain S-box-containing protein
MTTPARILVVEDDRVVARDIAQQMSRAGHTVVGITARGEDALPLAAGTAPDLILMDVRLEGELDGIDTARLLRENFNLPVVFLTAYADEETVRRATVTEPFGYVLKPFDDMQLRTVVEMALYKHGAERRLRESEQRYAVTLSSIGDAVIATGRDSRINFINPVAEMLTGWARDEAMGRPLTDVFRVINETTRAPAEDPVTAVLSAGTLVGLANHTILLARDGREIAIDDSGSPIVDDRGEIQGVAPKRPKYCARRMPALKWRCTGPMSACGKSICRTATTVTATRVSRTSGNGLDTRARRLCSTTMPI